MDTYTDKEKIYTKSDKQCKITQSTDREIWVDIVKVIACILVVAGHLMQGIVKSGVMPDNEVYQWFNNTIYYFHVPLFFICSGYLYVKRTYITSLRGWCMKVLSKLIGLGVPYVVFTVITWAIKQAFEGAGSSAIDNIFFTLLVHPTSPYWYLYALFFMFLLIPACKTKRGMYPLLGISLLAHFFVVLNEPVAKIIPYGFRTVLEYQIWFVMGMVASVFNIKKMISHKKLIGVCAGIVFIMLSFSTFKEYIRGLGFFMGLIACASIILMCMDKEAVHMPLFNMLVKYTLPIFLMHSIFVASVRSVLMKIGVFNAYAHIVIEFAVGITGPMLVAYLAEKMKYPEFVLYPNKFITIK